MFLTIILTVVTCVVCYKLFHLLVWHVKRRRMYELASKFEGPPLLPIVGNAHMLLGNSEQVFNKITKLYETYPSPSRLWLGPILFFTISDPEQAKEICSNSNTQERGQFARDLMGALLGTGLITAPVSKWRSHRKLIRPSFNKGIINSFVEIFAVQSKILTEQLERNLGGPEFEISELLSACTLDIICESAMGVKVEAQSNKNCRYLNALQQVMDSFIERTFNFWLHSDFIFYRTKLGKDQQKNIRYLHSFAENVIKVKKAEILNHGNHQLDNEEANELPERKAVLDHLIKLVDNTGKLSDEELREEVNTLIVAGNDTTTVTLSCIILMLASHPDVQDKVYQELYEIYGNTDNITHPVTVEDLIKMKYLERVIKETLRLFPAVPFMIRQVTEDVNMGERTFARGSYAVISIYNLHRKKEYWPDPLAFDPDRFLPEENAKRHPYAFMSFGNGPRSCLGSKYSMMLMKTLIATIVRQYVLKKDVFVPVKDIRLRLEITMQPVEPMKIRIEKRTRN